jgi:hypothetical protein
MLTRLRIRNSKRFGEADVELGQSVVFIGPNNSGKTTALQALALWDVGLRKWNERREGKTSPEKRPGVTISRRDLIAIPVPDANLLWRNLHVRDVRRANGRQETKHVNVDVIVDGVTAGQTWSCGFEFDYANEVVLNEAANRDVVIAFVGKPHRMDDRGQQVVKALTDIGFDHYYQADLKGWVSYLEGSTATARRTRQWCARWPSGFGREDLNLILHPSYFILSHRAASFPCASTTSGAHKSTDRHTPAF